MPDMQKREMPSPAMSYEEKQAIIRQLLTPRQPKLKGRYMPVAYLLKFGRFNALGLNSRKSVFIISPRTSEDWIPLVVIDWKFKFDFFLQRKPPFGLLIRVPFIWFRWGSA